MTAITSFSGEHAFLSNFAPSPILMDGIEFATVEHAFQAMKTLDAAMRKSIAVAPTPGKAKRMGRKVALRHDWEQVKIDVMRDCLRLKFADSQLMQMLINTASAALIEGNTWGDTFWGCVNVGGQWRGQNNLGKLLMEIRHDHANNL